MSDQLEHTRDPGMRRTSRHTSSRTSPGRQGRSMLEPWMLVVLGVAVLIAVALGVRAAVSHATATGGKRAGAAASSPAKAKTDPKGTVKAVPHAAAAAVARAQSTAVFASLRGHAIDLHFPAIPEDMIAVGFHQAWNVHATEMVPRLKTLPDQKYAATKSALRSDPSLKLFVMMSRGRGSSRYSAADCAVRPGSLILAPVTGVIAKVKTYILAGYGLDYQVEIKPDGASGLRVVLIHIRDVTVKVGDRVEGGVTPLATVRHLTGIDNQVNRYLPVQADHTHVQINDAGYTLSGGN
jgi:hypothetical protein